MRGHKAVMASQVPGDAMASQVPGAVLASQAQGDAPVGSQGPVAVLTAASRTPRAVAEDEQVSLDPVLQELERRRPGFDRERVVRAYDIAVAAHEGQYRLSGEQFIVHPLSVALVTAEIGLDDVGVSAALLHDVVEDAGVSLELLEHEVGPRVAGLVDGLTKLDRMRFSSREAQQAATVRKMIVAMASDWRVLVIKLADRLHNMRTIAVMPEWKQHRTARETLDVYAPLAHRLGIQEMKWQLEDLAFATLYPKEHAEIERLIALRTPERAAYLDRVLPAVRGALADLGIEARVTGRPKHLWSIYEKMVVKGKSFDDIYDLVGIRIVVTAEKDCWAALGTVHGMWSPVHGRFKDYVNSPKFNLYQALHTTVVGPEGKPIEVQVRTEGMDRRAEQGVAAHWDYKERRDGRDGRGDQPAAGTPAESAWLRRIADLEEGTSDPREFLEGLKGDLVKDETYVFTPKGKVIALPEGATPIDFAYAVHTEVGHRCIGAKVNGRLVALTTSLKSADTVEIFTSKVESAGPSPDWLRIVVTPRARSKIRQWLSRERRDDAIDAGRDELARALAREGAARLKGGLDAGLKSLAASMNYVSVDSLYAALGSGHVSARTVVQRLLRDLGIGEHDEQAPMTVRSPHRRRRDRSLGVYVEGLDDVMVRLSACCSPVPGDEIMGFVTRGRGVSVHRVDCANAISLTAEAHERLIEVEWGQGVQSMFLATIEVRSLDRPHLLADVARALAEHHVAIVSSATSTGADRMARMRFEIELADQVHLELVLASLSRVDGVFDVYRVLPGGRT